MISNVKNLVGVDILTKSQQGSILGGQSCNIQCNSGNWINGAPDASESNQIKSCRNQGGPTGNYVCSGNP